jgi:hypothetical protein
VRIRFWSGSDRSESPLGEIIFRLRYHKLRKNWLAIFASLRHERSCEQPLNLAGVAKPGL